MSKEKGKESAERKQWEYQTFSVNPEEDVAGFDHKLNEAGEKGWELVGVVPTTSTAFLVFKRPRGWG
jgi:hypothetical protein